MPAVLKYAESPDFWTKFRREVFLCFWRYCIRICVKHSVGWLGGSVHAKNDDSSSNPESVSIEIRLVPEARRTDRHGAIANTAA